MIIQNKKKAKAFEKKPETPIPLDYSDQEEVELYDFDEFFVVVNEFKHYLISNKGNVLRMNGGGNTREITTYNHLGRPSVAIRKYNNSYIRTISNLMRDTFGDECPERFK
jgi:hypothetical protein